MERAKEFLAEEVLVEKRVVTYRYLSRALKVHVNVSKKALYDFHRSQNAKKQGSVHATYVIYGRKPAEAAVHDQNGNDGDADVAMEDPSAEVDIFVEHTPTFCLTLVAEANLKDALSEYESIESIHVYSLASQPTTDLQILSDSTRQLRELRETNGSEESPKTYGTIPNPHARRRQRKGQAPGQAAAASKPAAKPVKPLAPEEVPGPNSIWNKVAAKSAVKPLAPHEVPGPNSIWNKIPKKSEAAAAKPASGSESPASSGADTKKPGAAPPLKRAGSSASGGIMQAFAKGAAAAKPKKKTEPSQLSKPPVDEDTAMGLSDDGGDDDTDLIPKAQQVTGGKSRKEREDELLKMMEEDDEEEEEKGEDEREDTPMEDIEEPPAEPAAPKPEEPAEVISTSKGDGRRRGKRRVTKKKMIEDENGYLVTIQEQGWESFSEDEAPSKPAPTAPAATSQASKPKKAAPKTGQGNIMSFFSKK